MPASEQILKRTIHFDNDPVGPFYDATVSMQRAKWDGMLKVHKRE